MSAGTCDYHADEPVEAETVERGGLTYTVLRCPHDQCGKTRGMRLVRRRQVRHAVSVTPMIGDQAACGRILTRDDLRTTPDATQCAACLTTIGARP